MTSETRIGDQPVTVVLDLRYPHAYLALHPAIAFGESLGVEIDWLPLPAATLKAPIVAGDDDDRGVRHRFHRAQAIRREIEIYSEAQGLVLRDFYRDSPTDAVNLAWLWMREQRPDRLESFLVQVFSEYWSLELDASNAKQVAERLSSHGGDAQEFLGWAATDGPARAAELVEAIHARGVFAVPSYLVEDEVFLGRQHLPMMKWILEGRKGPVPI